ncbi:hypothetical protein VI817_001036 [Penicillium citrinum]|nr:hypothetical protein VI817_001036 [Penicillium citrinum]
MPVDPPDIHFPNDPVLARLIDAARQTSASKKIIYDELGFEKSYSDLLGDIVQLREALFAHFPSWVVSSSGRVEELNTYVTVSSRSGYEFLVAFFAIRAAGGVCVPIGSGALPEEAHYMLEKAKSTIMLVGQDCIESGENIRTYMCEHTKSTPSIVIPIQTGADSVLGTHVEIDNSVTLDPAGPGMVLFTSGTTGRPKGVVLPRICFAELQAVEQGNAVLNHRPGHWIGGARNLIEPVVTGGILVSIGEKVRESRAEAVLHALAKHKITDVFFTPALLRWMKHLLTDEDGGLSTRSLSKYSGAFNNLSSIKCTGGVCESSTIEFWKSLTGLPFETTYAGTEMGGIACRSRSNVRNAFDSEGYYKTNDLAEYKDGEYVFRGRSNADFVLFQNYRFSTIPIESLILDLPYFDEACVLPVPDPFSRQVCAVVARLNTQHLLPERQIGLSQIRKDLLERGMAVHMLPILLRVLGGDEVLPRTTSNKPMKRKIAEQYFGSMDGLAPIQLPACVERLDLPKASNADIKPWDWCGMQSAG